MYRAITSCRICGNPNLISLLHLGDQALTGVFPKSPDERISSGPLEWVKCHPQHPEENVCHLVQLRHSFSSEEMYGQNYGYRSGLNASMVKHLAEIVEDIRSRVQLKPGDLVIDIGSNDSTLLQHYSTTGNLTLLGIDPTGNKFKKFYPSHIQLIPDFFSEENIRKHFPGRKAKAISSIAMFYDLENPIEFVKQVYEVLDDEGIWVFEQSYLPEMLRTKSYDTICHEHLEYYSLHQIQYMMDIVGFRIIDVELNDVNGGSFCVTVSKKSAGLAVSPRVRQVLEAEQGLKLEELGIYAAFKKEIEKHRENLKGLIRDLKQAGKIVFGYGASTKGNVLLQYCGITVEEIPCIAEVNEDKFGAYTPFTHIPIISEADARERKPDFFLVLPWHFRKGIIEKEQEFLASGGKFIFPLPEIEILGK